MPVAHRNPLRANAFTLIELIAVIALISIGIGLSAVALSSVQATSLSTATRHVADFLSLSRSRAISEHTVVRFGVVVDAPPDFASMERRAYSSWNWDRKRKRFEQSSSWKFRPGSIAFAPELDRRMGRATYVKNDPSSIRGEIFTGSGHTFRSEDTHFGELEIAFVEFTAAGRARVPGEDTRNLIALLAPGTGVQGEDLQNWSQLNVDALTGRVRVYRP